MKRSRDPTVELVFGVVDWWQVVWEEWPFGLEPREDEMTELRASGAEHGVEQGASFGVA